MPRLELLVSLLPLTLALLPACHHDDGRSVASTTTIRSGTMGGARVTNLPPSDEPRDERVAERLTTSICAHRRACADATNDDGARSSEALLLGESVCATEQQPSAKSTVAAWKCRPAPTSVELESCLAAVRAAPCRGTNHEEVDAIDACQSSALCR